jgi:hypothetical protein
VAEAVEILRLKLAGLLAADGNSVGCGSGNGAWIGRMADVIARCSRGIDAAFDAMADRRFAKRTFGHGGTANVPKADKQHRNVMMSRPMHGAAFSSKQRPCLTEVIE